MAATPAWLASAEALFNRSLGTAAAAADVARRLEGTSLQLEIDGMLTIRASVVHGRLDLAVVGVSPGAGADARPADAVIAGSPLALLQLLRGGARRVGQSSGAQIRGDAEIANLYRELFSLGRPDLEEELSRIVGDLAARRLARFASGTLSWLRGARRTAGENIAEYLQEESRDLVGRTEVDEFLARVDAVRESADRVAARLAHFEMRLKGSV